MYIIELSMICVINGVIDIYFTIQYSLLTIQYFIEKS